MKGTQGWLGRLPVAGVGNMVMVTVKKDKSELRERSIQQWSLNNRSHSEEKMGCLYSEDNAGVMANSYGQRKVSATTGPAAEGCAD